MQIDINQKMQERFPKFVFLELKDLAKQAEVVADSVLHSSLVKDDRTGQINQILALSQEFSLSLKNINDYTESLIECLQNLIEMENSNNE